MKLTKRVSFFSETEICNIYIHITALGVCIYVRAYICLKGDYEISRKIIIKMLSSPT